MMRVAQSASLAEVSLADRQACEDQHPDAVEQCDKRAKRRVVRGSTTARAFRFRTMLWRTWIATSASPPRTTTRVCETHHPCGLVRMPNPGPARNCASLAGRSRRPCVRYHGALPRSCWRSRVRTCRFLPSLSPVLQVSGVNRFEESCGERSALKIVRSVAAELRNSIGSTRTPLDLLYSICSGSVLDADQC